MLKNLDNAWFFDDDIDCVNVKSDITFFSDNKSLVNIYLDNVSLDDYYFDNDDPETITYHQELQLGVTDISNARHVKKKSKELISAAWHLTR